MRYVLTALMGLIALGGVQARSLPGMDNALGKRAPDIDISKRVPGPPGTVPRPPTRPPVRPLPGSRPNGGASGDDEIEQNDLADTSDVVTISPCGAAKRGIDDFAFEAPLERRMSGQGKALPWEAPADAPSWQTILAELDAEVGNELAALNPPFTEKIRIIWAGGISGLRYGSRGDGGVTGDIDMTYDDATPQEARDAMFRAINTVLGRHTDILKFKPLSITNSLASRASTDRLAAWTASDTANPWEGQHIVGVDGDWGLQLFGKMNRMYQMREQGRFKQRDQADSKVFFQNYIAAKGVTEITMEHFRELSALFEKDQPTTDNIVAKTIKLVAGDALVGVAQNVKDIVTNKGC